MKNKNSGFATPSVLIIILVLCISLSSVAFFMQNSMTKINSIENKYKRHNEAMDLCQSLLNDFQTMAEEECDDFENSSFLAILDKYREQNLVLKDVSTGINPDLVEEKVLKDSAFVHITSDPDSKYLVKYGWLNSTFNVGPKNKIEEKSLDKSVMNEIPPMNLFSMDFALLEALLQYLKISDFKEKTEVLYRENPELKNDIEKCGRILGINKDHKFFSIVGFKTTFWQFELECDSFSVQGIIAGIPEENNRNKIGKYIIINKNISDKGGAVK